MFATEEPRPAPLMTSSTRRTTLRHGALLAALGTISLHHSAAGQATPVGDAGSANLLVQSFGTGSLFPTQGDAGVLPFTAILWDAAERGFLVLAPAGGSVGVATTDSVLSALAAANEPPPAVLVTLSGGDSATGALWALRLVSGSLGSDPGAVTYQGEPLTGEDAPTWLGASPELPDGPQDLGAGYLVLVGVSGFAAT